MKKNVLIVSILLIFFMFSGCNKQFDETTICKKYLPAVVEISLIINEGNSGGPLITETGELVGITTFRLRDNQNNIIYGTSFALTTKSIKDFLNQSK